MTRVGLVLGAGGVTGEAFHRGVLRALRDVAGFDARRAEVIVGTSAGALVAASLRCSGSAALPPAAAAPPDAALSRLPDPRALLAVARRPWQARAGVLATSLLPAGRQPTDIFTAAIRARCGSAWPAEDTYICAVRRRDGRRVVFGMPGAPDIDVATAVGASCAIPGYFRPVVHGGEVYVDGGVHSPTNADVLAGRGLDLVVVSSPMSVSPRAVRPKLDLSVRMMWHRYVAAERHGLERHGTAVLTVEPGGDTLRALGLNALRAARVDQIEELAHDATVAELNRPAMAGRVALLTGGPNGRNGRSGRKRPA
ncbi:MAG TPA: patatin-like phospholipase family protein [Frankiaceae bacterium]|nr:patatin-like phospholipase family protein [Frankiaceae bacterium]